MTFNNPAPPRSLLIFGSCISALMQQLCILHRLRGTTQNHDMRSVWVDAEIRSWIECARCGRIDKPGVPIWIPEEIAFTATERVCATCERCHGHALMVLQRAVPHLH